MSKHEHENDDDHDYEDDDGHEQDDDHGGTASNGSNNVALISYVDTSLGQTNATSNLSSDNAKGYQFTTSNGAVSGITEIEHGSTQLKRLEYGETWTVSGDQVIKTEIEHGFTQTSIYADADGDGIFTKISQTYSPQATSAASNVMAVNSIQGGYDTDDNWTGTGASEHYYGSVGNDSLRGGDGDDDLYGGNDDDDLHGDEGDDHLYGSNGNDHLYGGNGTDDAYFEGNRSDYALIRASSNVQIVDNNPLRDGTDVLESVERIHFADMSLALDTDGVSGKAYRLYKAAFDRESDNSGLGYWIAQLENGVTLNDVAMAFLTSDEFHHRHGNNIGDDEFVNLLYNNVLDRDADADGYAYWTNQLHSTLTRTDVLLGFSESVENKSNVAELISSGITYQEWLG